MSPWWCSVCNERPSVALNTVTVTRRGRQRRYSGFLCQHCGDILDCMLGELRMDLLPGAMPMRLPLHPPAPA